MLSDTMLMNEMDGLKKFAFKLCKSQHDADDLLQSTVLRALQNKEKFDDFYFGQILNDEEQINKFEKLILNNRNIIDKFILFENEIEEIQKAILMGIPPKNIIRIKCE